MEQAKKNGLPLEQVTVRPDSCTESEMSEDLVHMSSTISTTGGWADIADPALGMDKHPDINVHKQTPQDPSSPIFWDSSNKALVNQDTECDPK